MEDPRPSSSKSFWPVETLKRQPTGNYRIARNQMEINNNNNIDKGARAGLFLIKSSTISFGSFSNMFIFS